MSEISQTQKCGHGPRCFTGGKNSYCVLCNPKVSPALAGESNSDELGQHPNKWMFENSQPLTEQVADEQPKSKVYTHSELELHEQIATLKSSRNYWRFMFFAAVVCYGLVLWGLK